MTRMPLLAEVLGFEGLEIVAAMASGEWYRDDDGQRADSAPGHQDPGSWG